MGTKTGDSVKLWRSGGALRLDREDAEALQGLVYEALARVVGGLVGVGSGCLTRPRFVVDAAEVSVGECVLFWAYPAGGAALGNPEGMVLRHDPGRAGQVSTVSLAAYAAGEGRPYLWARRVEVETAPGARKKWTTAEVDDVSPTRIEERVEFEAALENPDPAAGWFAFARVSGWSVGGLPSVWAISALDALEGALDGLGFGSLTSEQLDKFGDFGARAGFGAVVEALARVMDSRWAFERDEETGSARAVPSGTPALGPFSETPRGIAQLHEALTALETGVGGSGSVSGSPPLLWVGRFGADGDAASTTLWTRTGFAAPTVTRQSVTVDPGGGPVTVYFYRINFAAGFPDWFDVQVSRLVGAAILHRLETGNDYALVTEVGPLTGGGTFHAAHTVYLYGLLPGTSEA